MHEQTVTVTHVNICWSTAFGCLPEAQSISQCQSAGVTQHCATEVESAACMCKCCFFKAHHDTVKSKGFHWMLELVWHIRQLKYFELQAWTDTLNDNCLTCELRSCECLRVHLCRTHWITFLWNGDSSVVLNAKLFFYMYISPCNVPEWSTGGCLVTLTQWLRFWDSHRGQETRLRLKLLWLDYNTGCNHILVSLKKICVVIYEQLCKGCFEASL